MGFTPLGNLPNPFSTNDPRSVVTERTFKEPVYFEKDVIFSSGGSAQALARSANFSIADETGWALNGAGGAWLYGTVVLGSSVTLNSDLWSSNWNGANPANLATRDAAATAGYYLDHSVGAAQFVSLYADGGELRTLSVLGALTLGTNGIFQSASSGQRIVIDAANNDRVQFFSGGAKENGSINTRIMSSADGSGYPSLTIWGPSDTDSGNDWNTMAFHSSGASNYGLDVISVYQKIRFDSRGDGAGGNGNLEFWVDAGERVSIDASGVDMHSNDIADVGTLGFGGAVELTIATGAITVTQTFHTLDTEGDAATDDLTDINGGVTGDLLILRPITSARDVTVKHNSSKIALAGSADLTFGSSRDTLTLVKITSTIWSEVSRMLS